MIREFLQFLLGSPGRLLYSFITDNIIIFCIIATIYSILMLYSKYMIKCYIPSKIRKFVKEFTLEKEISIDNGENLVKIIHEKWMDEVKRLPKYVIVPSRNELWVTSMGENYLRDSLLPYSRSKKMLMSDEQIIRDILLKKNKD